jgi:AraC family transcriptional regulator
MICRAETGTAFGNGPKNLLRWALSARLDAQVRLATMHAQLQFSNARIDCRQAHYQAGALRPRHYHDSAWVVFTLSGSFGLTMRSAENLLTPRSLAYVPAGEPHSNVFGSQGAGVFVTAIDPAWIGDRMETVSAEAEKPRIAPAGLLTGLALKIYREFRSPDALSDLIMEGAFLELLGGWLRHDFHKDRGAALWLRRVKGLLHDSFRGPVSLNQVAQAAGVHPSHAAREFRRAYGMTIGEYVRKLRVEFVAERLVQPHKDTPSLTDLALDAGFSSHAHMAAVFNRVVGMPPSHYRKAHGFHPSVSHQSVDKMSIS